MPTAHFRENKRRTVLWHQLVTFIWNNKILKFKELKEMSQAPKGSQCQLMNRHLSKFHVYIEYSELCLYDGDMMNIYGSCPAGLKWHWHQFVFKWWWHSQDRGLQSGFTVKYFLKLRTEILSYIYIYNLKKQKKKKKKKQIKEIMVLIT